VKDWALPATVIVALEYLVALAIGFSVGFHYSIPVSTYVIVGCLAVSIFAVGSTLALLAFYAWEQEPSPARRLLSNTPRLGSFATGSLLVTAQVAVLMWLKVEMPLAVGFWADPFLAEADRALFGAEPWRIAQALFGWAVPFIDRVYVLWAPAKFTTLILVLAMPESLTKSRALLAYFLTVAMGAIGQYLLPSAGPIFYSQLGLGDRFSELPVQPWVHSAQQYLWQDYLNSGGQVGGGISAMPSLHVAVSVWIALALGSYSKLVKPLAWAFAAIIFVGSIQLGWHYALDSVAGVAIACLAWCFARFSLRPRRRWNTVTGPVFL